MADRGASIFLNIAKTKVTFMSKTPYLSSMTAHGETLQKAEKISYPDYNFNKNCYITGENREALPS